MAYVAVNKDGSEIISEHLPKRTGGEVKVVDEGEGNIRYRYTAPNYWVSYLGGEDGSYETQIDLPKGTIKRLIGKELTWQDEPVELTIDSLAQY